MIIGIDASKAGSSQKTGIENTAFQIILGLKQIDKKNQYFLYTNKKLPKELIGEKFTEKMIPFPKFWSRFRLPLALMRDKPDLFLELTNNIPPAAPEKTIVLIHDFAFKLFPKAYSKYELLLQENAIKIAINKAKMIVFTSKANLDDFNRLFHSPEVKTSVIPLGYDTRFNSAIKSKDLLNLYSPYFLFVGRLEKRKNVIKIIEAFEIFKSKNKTLLHKLVLVGKNGFGHNEIEQKISGSTYKNDIIKPGYLKDADIPRLYKNAEALIYPSLYEGFGFPILEAMAAGTPVITSNIPTLKEIANDCPIFIDPLDSKAIADAMQKVTANRSLREEIISAGKINVKKYSWEKTAKKYYELIQSLQ